MSDEITLTEEDCANMDIAMLLGYFMDPSYTSSHNTVKAALYKLAYSGTPFTCWAGLPEDQRVMFKSFS